jgi:hypothetical protein
MSRNEFPFHGLNYPSDVRESDARAPWNAPDVRTCPECGAEWNADTGENAPRTEHGARFEFCSTCERETSVCVECGERWTSTEPRADVCGACQTVPAFARCPECGAEHSPADVGATCRTCGRGTVRGYATRDTCGTCYGTGNRPRRAFERWNAPRVPCRECDGTGRARIVQTGEPCPECDGTGEREISIGGDGDGDRCAALADVPTVCIFCDGTGRVPE